MQRILVPFMVALAVVAGPTTTLVASAPPAAGPVLVVAADPEGVIRRAGGRPLGPARARFGAPASPADPGFARRLADHGAWFVLDGRVVAAICGVER